MSGGGWKKPFEQVAAQDSRNLADLFNKLGIQPAEDEARHNVRNPGRAITKAAEYATMGYLGSLAAGGEGGVAADAANSAPGAYEALTAEQIAQNLAPVTMGENVGLLAGGTPETASSLAMQSATPQAGGLLNSLAQGKQLAMNQAYRAMVPGVGSQQADMLAAQTGDFGAYGLGQTMKAASGAQGLSPMQSTMGQYGGRIMSNLGGAKGKSLALQQGMKLAMPQQQQRPMPSAPPAPQGQQQPLTNPYQNSLMMGLSEEDKQRLRALGYRI